MLARLRIEGFKNIGGADPRFGPFTCIAGANGIGKSNLFDAITFLGRLADESCWQNGSTTSRRSTGWSHSGSCESISRESRPLPDAKRSGR